jgi:hypothetical protein
VQSWCSTGSFHEFVVRKEKVKSAVTTRASRSRGTEQTTAAGSSWASGTRRRHGNPSGYASL